MFDNIVIFWNTFTNPAIDRKFHKTPFRCFHLGLTYFKSLSK